ncbi:CC0125/CC1285 family lipoprotein [Piscinibacter gummiphilus]|uniref:EF-hand domain-containing protein n=1 Tax=Piscinibacter gummiphilus TaxID=946333 RepID=A0ABZ0D025_9BURK|nr:hypothetical protein [Piscinibacter gummiphilus]WOB10505.1 hypothetical protein RXV79_10680 [Piscinibacter gummiphilus]
MKKVFVIAMLSWALGGCATQYGSSGFTGGHTDRAGPGKLQKVDFNGNGYITSELVQKYALYRCAELAKQKGKQHFIIYDSLFAAALDRPSALPRVGTLGNKPSATAFMLLLDEPRSGSKQAQAVIDEIDPVIKANNPTQR